MMRAIYACVPLRAFMRAYVCYCVLSACLLKKARKMCWGWVGDQGKGENDEENGGDLGRGEGEKMN